MIIFKTMGGPLGEKLGVSPGWDMDTNEDRELSDLELKAAAEDQIVKFGENFAEGTANASQQIIRRDQDGNQIVTAFSYSRHATNSHLNVSEIVIDSEGNQLTKSLAYVAIGPPGPVITFIFHNSEDGPEKPFFNTLGAKNKSDKLFRKMSELLKSSIKSNPPPKA